MQIAKLNNRTKVVRVIEDFIKYKNMPRDKSGKVIIDKNAIAEDLRSKIEADDAKKAAAQKKASANNASSQKKAAQPQQPAPVPGAAPLANAPGASRAVPIFAAISIRLLSRE